MPSGGTLEAERMNATLTRPTATGTERCPWCEHQAKQVAAGICRSNGRPYKAFASCGNGCRKEDGDLRWNSPKQWGFYRSHPELKR